MLQEPVWSDFCQDIERMTHRFSHTFQATKRANSCQHVRGVGSLLASRLDPPTLPTSLQQQIEEAAYCTRGLSVSQSFGILHDRHQGKAPRSLGWLPSLGKEILKILILIQGS